MRIVLGAFLVFAGYSHFANTAEFIAQVPPFLPNPELVIYLSGVVEVLLGFSLIFVKSFRPYVGIVTAAFFIAIFPGNLSQFFNHVDGFGLDTDSARAIRLIFQPVLVVWAIWSTESFATLKKLWNREV
ncbi:MAG: hypothetical protein RLZZ330_12 [Actinomycetota bacterium]|jgi:uncharacterized membrane protein